MPVGAEAITRHASAICVPGFCQGKHQDPDFTFILFLLASIWLVPLESHLLCFEILTLNNKHTFDEKLDSVCGGRLADFPETSDISMFLAPHELRYVVVLSVGATAVWASWVDERAKIIYIIGKRRVKNQWKKYGEKQ
ncbi:hypothetical protein ACJX0J_014353, partial [Zea mays]